MITQSSAVERVASSRRLAGSQGLQRCVYLASDREGHAWNWNWNWNWVPATGMSVPHGNPRERSRVRIKEYCEAGE